MSEPIQGLSSQHVLSRLILLLKDLYAATDGFLERQDDAQCWYDRGYANGLAAAVRELGHGAALASLGSIDPSDIAADQAQLPWGKAYAHGYSMGHKETFDVLETA